MEAVKVIGFDIASQFFRSTASTRNGRYSYATNSSVAMSCHCSSSSRRGLSALRPVRQPITGHTNSKRLDTQCA
jgi:hypothetical protein